MYVGGAATEVIIDVQGYYTGATNTWTYTYSADGLRQNKVGPPCCSWVSSLTNYTWSLEGLPQVLREQTGQFGPPIETFFIYGPGGLPVEQVTGGTPLFLHHDQLGSTRFVTNTAGDIAGAYSYDAYGTRTDSWLAPNIRHGYAGQWHDTETGLIYLRARYYDPTTGQFLTRDPIEAVTRSAYGYVYGNPINLVDPSGLESQDLPGGWCIRIPFTDDDGCEGADGPFIPNCISTGPNDGCTSYGEQNPDRYWLPLTLAAVAAGLGCLSAFMACMGFLYFAPHWRRSRQRCGAWRALLSMAATKTTSNGSKRD